MIKRCIKEFLTVWWIPIVAYFIPVGIFLLGVIFRRDSIITVSLVIFTIIFLGNFASSIRQIAIRKWYFVFPQLVISISILMYGLIVFSFSPPDYYGAHKKIPKGLEIYETPEEKLEYLTFGSHQLMIFGWGGNYGYLTNYNPDNIGFFYIKAFEVTSGDRLSEIRMNEESKVMVNELELQHYEGEFNIYEGSWGDKYGARIELWYQPSNKEEEFMVTYRNYIIEGWMR